ncbi:MAG: ABC transporter permease [Gammaproteobacteria bacterium]|nr:ABC transporter permease [Gammaproteobacteria bacterium]
MIELRDLAKSYRLGGNAVFALRGITLTIEAGEFVAIMGPSGSGKSTLMHMLGLLDTPDSGSFRLDGREVAHLSEDHLADLRREAVGFVFQQFNLLPRMTAAENVALPLLYSMHRPDLARAEALLARVGLGERSAHRPNELSGGQQQRVAIARSLVNRPRIILADEPTGNLDSASQHEILELLSDLNRQGMTVIMVTHEEDVARVARRRIRIRDGRVQSDERSRPEASNAMPHVTTPAEAAPVRLRELAEHLRQGLLTLAANKVRTGLSMLGILIGVAAVIAMLGLGRGAQMAIEKQLASLGSNLLVLRSGAHRVGGVAQDVGAATRLTIEDVTGIRERVPGVKEASATVSGRARLAYLNRNRTVSVLGVGTAYQRMRAAEPSVGRFFTDEENHRRARVAVIGMTVVRELFGEISPLGEQIKINRINFQVVGILPEKGATTWQDQDDVVVIPVQTAMHRLLGKEYVDYIDVESVTREDMEHVQSAVVDLMVQRHRVPPSQREDAFTIRNMAEIQSAMSETSRTMSMLLAAIATISLVVGGIGIMNIMLVSVTERTREIGLRKAVGARPRDILTQFLSEALVVSVVGGLAGILLGWISTVILSALAGWSTSVSMSAILLAFMFSAGIGVVFGIYPARKAAQLNPIEALRHE